VGEEEAQEPSRAAPEVENRRAVPVPIGRESREDVRVHAASDLLETPPPRLRVGVCLRADPDAHDELVRWDRADHPRSLRTEARVSSRLPVREHEAERRHVMAVARVTEISSTSSVSFEDAVKTGIERANQTLRNVKSAWIKEQQVRLEGGAITEYQVNMLVTFVLDE
jgi:flavin-binding protein dodecin